MIKYQEKTLEYFYSNGKHVIFNKYIIDTLGVIKNKISGKMIAYKIIAKYQICGVLDDMGIKHTIRVGRSVASTFLGPPSTLKHTADHINSNEKTNDTLENIRWLGKLDQTLNQNRPETYKKCFIVVKDGVEKTIKDWVDYLKDTKTPFGNDYTSQVIHNYSKQNMLGFSYKEYRYIKAAGLLRSLTRPQNSSSLSILRNLKIPRDGRNWPKESRRPPKPERLSLFRSAI